MRRGLHRAWSPALAAALLLPAAAAAQTALVPREALEQFEAQLDRAVSQVSRPATAVVLGRVESARGYHLPGYGAVFVLTPRALPREGNVLVFRQRSARPALAAPRNDDRTFTVRATPPAADREADELVAIEQQVLDFQREAEDARQNAEREFERITRDIRVRLAPPPDAAGAAAAPPAPVPTVPTVPPGPKAPSTPIPAPAPVPATAPAPPAEPAPPGAANRSPSPAGSPLPPPPPWRFWFEGGPPDGRPPAKVIADVRAAVIASLEAEGGHLKGLAPDEYVTVAVDFIPASVFVFQARPTRTVVVRARKGDLEARLLGRLSVEDLRARVEVSEY